MKKLSPIDVRMAMIRSGAIAPDSKKPEAILRHKAPPAVSRVNAILARRQSFAHA
jgi:hypothetical protein